MKYELPFDCKPFKFIYEELLTPLNKIAYSCKNWLKLRTADAKSQAAYQPNISEALASSGAGKAVTWCYSNHKAADQGSYQRRSLFPPSTCSGMPLITSWWSCCFLLNIQTWCTDQFFPTMAEESGSLIGEHMFTYENLQVCSASSMVRIWEIDVRKQNYGFIPSRTSWWFGRC